MSWFVLATDAFGGYGGIAQFNRDFVQALAKTPGVGEIEILPRIAPNPPDGLPANVAQAKPELGRIAYSLRAARRVLALRPKVIFCGHVYMVVLASLLARAVGAKLVVMTHGIEIWYRLAATTGRALARADLVLCASRDTRAWVLRIADVPPERVVVINNTVAQHYQPGDASSLRQSLDVGAAKLILSISRLDAGQQYKGQDRIIPLLPRLVADGVDAVYLIGGVGPDRERLEALAAQHEVTDRVRFLGHVPAEQLPDYYRAVDLFAMPSTGEGFGIVFLEAMASGTPALGLAAGGAVDALADGALGGCVQADELYPALYNALTAAPDRQGLEQQVLARFAREKYEQRVVQIVRRLGPESAAHDSRCPVSVAAA